MHLLFQVQIANAGGARPGKSRLKDKQLTGLDQQLLAHCLQTIKATSIEESILKVVMSLTTDDGQWISMTLLWILISYLSQVLVPSPHGDFLVVTLKILVGILSGPLVS